jgi:hypothetical protein
MKNLFVILFLLSFVSSFAQRGYKFERKIFGYSLNEIDLLTSHVDSIYFIEKMIVKIWRPSPMVSDTALAMGYYGYVLQYDYHPDRFIGLELKIMRHNDNKEWKKALKLADSLLNNYPVCLMGHVEMCHAYNSLQDTIKAKQHKIIYERLGNMILKTGDGKSMETAYVVTGLKDVEVLTQIQRMRIIKRIIKRKQKQTFEIVTVFKNFEQFDLYFDTSLIQEFRKY